MQTKKQKAHECIIKRKLTFEDFVTCLEAAQIENKINHLGKKTKLVKIIANNS